MKSQIIITASLLLSLIFFTACNSESSPADLQEEVQALKEIEKRSEKIESKNDAFNVLRDLNLTIKDIRNKVLEMEERYREVSENEKKQMDKEFEQANREIDRSLGIISENSEPYKDHEDIAKMIDKLNEVLISK
jgi:hypothetical protein